jgi:VWFA-related protein
MKTASVGLALSLVMPATVQIASRQTPALASHIQSVPGSAEQRHPTLSRVQSQSSAGSAQQPGYTLRTDTRIVLTDVTVTDRQGNPVHCLKASDFQIFDNNKPESLKSFEEHTTMDEPPVEQASAFQGVYSNEFLLHLPPVLNIIVVDITNLEIPDQMYLRYELDRFINRLPAGQPIAIYWQSGEANLLLQNFTSDHALLLAAVRKAIPRFPPPARGLYVDPGFATLQAIAGDFAQYPGRKNVLWFSGGSTLSLSPDPMNPNLGLAASPDPGLLQNVYDELEASRIAIYPVDARGLQVGGNLEPIMAIGAQQSLMHDIADATGGTAFYNSNGFDSIAARWLDNAGSFYTITYSPDDFRFDNKWHKVTVKLAPEFRGYTLSYRSGYFADGSSGVPQEHQKPRTLLLADGSSLAAPDQQSIPIVFEAHVEPALPDVDSAQKAAATANMQPPKKRTIPYSIHYSLPADAFTAKTVDGKHEIDIGIAVVAFNEDGFAETHLTTWVRFTLGSRDRKDLSRKRSFRIPLDQQIDLHKGQKYLYLAAWDRTSGRLGTLQIPLKVASERKQ